MNGGPSMRSFGSERGIDFDSRLSDPGSRHDLSTGRFVSVMGREDLGGGPWPDLAILFC